MARMFPNTSVGALPPETFKVYQLLKRLPDEEYRVWQRLVRSTLTGPDFLVLHQDGRALLITVCSTTVKQAQNVGQHSMFAHSGDASSLAPGLAEQEALLQFASAVPTEPAGMLPAVVLFPNLAPADMQRIHPPTVPPGITWSGKDVLNDWLSWLSWHLSAPLPAATLAHLRAAFTPEVIIPVDFTVRQPMTRNIDAELTEYLLDYDQEWALKLDLDLSQDAETSARSFNLRLINGVAGSGKSLIVIYRTHLLRQLYPTKRMLVLTHNRALIDDLSHRYTRLQPTQRPVEWRTFFGWCRALWPTTQPWVPPITLQKRTHLIDQVRATFLGNTGISTAMLCDEIDWLKDRLPLNRAEYLTVDRSGRGFGLTEGLRQRVFDAVVDYQHRLHAQGRVDWGDIPRRLWKFFQEGIIQPPTYDSIHIDEAQFFAPLWFELIKHVLTPNTGQLFLVADPTQGFLKRRQSWLASGLEVRGRSQRLAKSYRTTREILTFATLWYQRQVPHDDDEIIAPYLEQMPHGPLPQIISLTSEQDAITRVVNELRALIKAAIPRQHILVLHTSWHNARRLRERLEREFGSEAVSNPQEARRDHTIRVCTLNAATGLESPIVFLLGLETLLEEGQSLRLTEEERQEVIRDHARRSYMAMTRAGQRLVIVYVGTVPDGLYQAAALTQQQTEAV